MSNTASRVYSDDQKWAQDSSRSYFYVLLLSGTGTIALGEGGAEMPLQLNVPVELRVNFTGPISVTTTGTWLGISNTVPMEKEVGILTNGRFYDRQGQAVTNWTSDSILYIAATQLGRGETIGITT